MTQQDIVHHYSAEATRRSALLYAGPLLGYPLKAYRYRELVWNFFRRDLFGRFRGSLLGIFWVLVQPVFLFAVYYLVFGFMFGAGRLPSGAPDPVFAIYLFSGVAAMLAFNEATGRACSVVVDNGNLVKKVAFPCELLPLHVVLVSTTVYIVSILMMLIGGSLLGGIQLDSYFLLWPLVLLVQVSLTLGIGMLLAQLYVFSRDLSHLWAIVGTTLTFVSPVFWMPRHVEPQLGSWFFLFTWNPLYALISAQRQVLGLGSTVTDPFWSNLLVAALWAAGFLILGYGLFMSRRHKFADLV